MCRQLSREFPRRKYTRPKSGNTGRGAQQTQKRQVSATPTTTATKRSETGPAISRAFNIRGKDGSRPDAVRDIPVNPQQQLRCGAIENNSSRGDMQNQLIQHLQTSKCCINVVHSAYISRRVEVFCYWFSADASLQHAGKGNRNNAATAAQHCASAAAACLFQQQHKSGVGV